MVVNAERQPQSRIEIHDL